MGADSQTNVVDRVGRSFDIPKSVDLRQLGVSECVAGKPGADDHGAEPAVNGRFRMRFCDDGRDE